MPKGIYPIEKRKGMFQKGYDKRRTGFKKGHPQFNTGREDELRR